MRIDSRDTRNTASDWPKNFCVRVQPQVHLVVYFEGTRQSVMALNGILLSPCIFIELLILFTVINFLLIWVYDLIFMPYFVTNIESAMPRLLEPPKRRRKHVLCNVCNSNGMKSIQLNFLLQSNSLQWIKMRFFVPYS